MEVADYLTFLEKTQKLKSTLRHSWTDNSQRQESTAEHSWHLALMVISLAPQLKRKINLELALKMAVTHDLGEALTGDIPAFKVTDEALKHRQEKEAIEQIVKTLPPKTQKELINLYRDYELKKTSEAIFIKRLDILDVMFQHLIADISTWAPEEWTFNLDKFDPAFMADEPFLEEIYAKIHQLLALKVAEAKAVVDN